MTKDTKELKENILQSPLESINYINEKYGIIKLIFERSKNQINDENLDLVNKMLNLEELFEHGTKAKIEVENLILVQNNNLKLVVKKILLGCKEIEDWIEKIESINVEVLKYKDSKQFSMWSKISSYYRIVYEPIIELLHVVLDKQNNDKANKLEAPELGLFCTLIHDSDIYKRDVTESAEVYCKRICDKFKLPYTDRVRQNYNVNGTIRLIKKLTERVLPLIDIETSSLIQKHLDSKQPTKQKLYA